MNKFNRPARVAGLVVAAALAALPLSADEAAIEARMASMKMIGKNIGIVAGMARGRVDFDAAGAQAALAVIAAEAAKAPELFALNVTNSESEALPAIWEKKDEFDAFAIQLAAAAGEGSGVDSLDALGPVLGAVGGTCRDCHNAFRE